MSSRPLLSRLPSERLAKRSRLDFPGWSWCEDSVPCMESFRRIWWGSGDKYLPRKGGGVLSIRQGSMTEQDTRRVCRRLGLLVESQGRLLVRDAYMTMFKRMEEASRVDAVRGVVVSGQPGVGKSVFSVLVLTICLSKSWPIAFGTEKGTIFLFDSTGVRTRSVSPYVDAVVFEEMQLPPGLSRAWILADCPHRKTQPLVNWFTGYSDIVFYAVFASPVALMNESSFRKDLAPQWIMPVWSIEELRQLIDNRDMFELVPNTIQALETADKSEVANDFHALLGGSVREFPLFMTDRNQLVLEMLDALQKLAPAEIRALVRDPLSEGNSDLAYQLLVIDRADSLSFNTVVQGNDRMIFRLKGGQFILNSLTEHLSKHSLEDSVRLYNACHNANSLGDSVADVVAVHAFEDFAIRFLAQGDNKSPILGPFTPMHQVAGHEYRFEHTSSQPAIGTSSFRTAISSVRNVKRYEDADLINTYTKDECKTIYVSRPSNNSRFGAFFYHSTGSCLRLYMLQVTISNTHSSVAGGFDVIKCLVKRARVANNPSIKANYVLVVPETLSSSEITWEMASRYSKAKGDVCIQFLRVGNWT